MGWPAGERPFQKVPSASTMMTTNASRPETQVRGRDQLLDFALSPFDGHTWRALGTILLGFFIATFSFAMLTALFSVGGTLLLFLVGFGIIGLGIELCRAVARVERWRMSLVDGRPLQPHPYRPMQRSLRGWTEAEFLDESRWRDVVYVLVSFPLAMIEFMVTTSTWLIAVAFATSPLWYESALGLGGPGRLDALVRHAPAFVAALFLTGMLVLLPVAAWLTRAFLNLRRTIVEGLLCVGERQELRQRVVTLRESRSAAIQVEASELRRIERDLHDGAQQRLVMLAIDLSLASDRVENDPAGARALMQDAREQARQALAELRDLVRGSAPAILLDRGLVAALGSVAGRCPVPTIVDSTLAEGERLPHAVERAAYFVVAEAMTNVAKHAKATRCEIRCRHQGNVLTVEVWDDGKGGATAAPGGGLAGLADRVEALDGKLTIDSPEGGPTLLRAEMPTLIE
jgi:signal transduction histidine kinase